VYTSKNPRNSIKNIRVFGNLPVVSGHRSRLHCACSPGWSPGAHTADSLSYVQSTVILLLLNVPYPPRVHHSIFPFFRLPYGRWTLCVRPAPCKIHFIPKITVGSWYNLICIYRCRKGLMIVLLHGILRTMRGN